MSTRLILVDRGTRETCRKTSANRSDLAGNSKREMAGRVGDEELERAEPRRRWPCPCAVRTSSTSDRQSIGRRSGRPSIDTAIIMRLSGATRPSRWIGDTELDSGATKPRFRVTGPIMQLASSSLRT
jgi:hypothetical protein